MSKIKKRISNALISAGVAGAIFLGVRGGCSDYFYSNKKAEKERDRYLLDMIPQQKIESKEFKGKNIEILQETETPDRSSKFLSYVCLYNVNKDSYGKYGKVDYYLCPPFHKWGDSLQNRIKQENSLLKVKRVRRGLFRSCERGGGDIGLVISVFDNDGIGSVEFKDSEEHSIDEIFHYVWRGDEQIFVSGTYFTNSKTYIAPLRDVVNKQIKILVEDTKGFLYGGVVDLQK